MVRRLASLALTAALLHLNLVRVDAACAEHDRGPDADVHQQSHHAGAEEHHGHAGDASAADENCDTPVQPECCTALASCSTSLGMNDDVAVAMDGDDRDSVASARADAALSRAAAPDPPPPRI